jgi:hypothetical protein
LKNWREKNESRVNIYTRFLSSVFKVLFDKKGELHLKIDVVKRSIRKEIIVHTYIEIIDI